MNSQSEIRADVHRWFREWVGTAPKRMCALLVAGYFRTREPFGVEGEEKYLLLRQPHGLALVELLEEHADRPLTPAMVEGFREHAGRAGLLFRRDALASGDHPQFDPHGLVECLRVTLREPRRGAVALLHWDLVTPSYSAIRQVRDCFCPADWLAAPPEWTPPAEALSWAQRIYDQRAFNELPILADMLEDADCPDRPLLDHCRSGKPHFRGCAALDRLLGNS